jgi:hypothetical protein
MANDERKLARSSLIPLEIDPGKKQDDFTLNIFI